MSRQAVINDDTNIVTNVIVLDEGTNWSPPEGHSVVPADVVGAKGAVKSSAGPGDIYAPRATLAKRFVRPPAVAHVPTPLEAAQTAYRAATTQTAKDRITMNYMALRLGLESEA